MEVVVVDCFDRREGLLGARTVGVFAAALNFTLALVDPRPPSTSEVIETSDTSGLLEITCKSKSVRIVLKKSK